MIVTDFRHEWKHPISYADMLILRQRLQTVMKPDRNAVDGKYFIRSLYFDTPADTALRESWTASAAGRSSASATIITIPV